MYCYHLIPNKFYITLSRQFFLYVKTRGSRTKKIRLNQGKGFNYKQWNRIWQKHITSTILKTKSRNLNKMRKGF